MVTKKTKTEKPAAAKPEEKKSEETPKREKAVTKVTVVVGGAERSGPVVSKRKASGKNQVCVKLEGFGSRWFNVEEIVK